MASTNKPPEIPPRRYSSTVSLNKMVNQNSIDESQPSSPPFLSRRHSTCIDDNLDIKTDTVGLMLVITCFLMVLAKSASSYKYTYRLNEQQNSKDCEQDGSYKTLVASGPTSTGAHKSNPFAGFYSQVNQNFMPFHPAPVVRTVEFKPGRTVAPVATKPLKTKIAVEPSFQVNHPEGVYTKKINKFDYGPVQSLSNAPYEYAPRIVPFQYISIFPSPILRNSEIEPVRILPIAPIVETKVANEPSLQVNPFMVMNKINTENTGKTRLESALVKFLRTADFVPSQYAEAAPLVKTNIAYPYPAPTSFINTKFIDSQVGFKVPPQYAESAPLIKTNIAYPNPAPAKIVAPALSYSYGQPTYQMFGANNWAYKKLAIRPHYDFAELDTTAIQESCEK